MATEAARNSGEEIQLVVFRLGEEDYGVPINQVREIIRMAPITIMPNTPDFVEGVINLRGRVIAVMDLKQRFGMARRERDEQTRIMVVEVGEQTLGFVVDTVSEVLRLPLDSIEPPPKAVSAIEDKYLQGVGKLKDRLLVLLDLEFLLSEQEQQELAGLETAQ